MLSSLSSDAPLHRTPVAEGSSPPLQKAAAAAASVALLPDEVWELISDVFQDSSQLRLVCQRLHALLLHRHISVRLHPSDVATPTKLERLAGLVHHTRSLVLHADGLSSLACGVHAVLQQAATLNHVALSLSPCPHSDYVGDKVVQALTTLQELPMLESISLNLQCRRISSQNLQAILARGFAPNVQFVCLSLAGWEVSSLLRATVTSLELLPNLRGLRLNLRSTSICGAGLRAIASIQGLQQLSLDLSGCGLTDETVAELAAVQHSPTLCVLELDLSSNSIRKDGLAVMCDALHQVPGLRKVRLTLDRNPLLNAGAECLAGLRTLTQLERLQLDLAHTGIGAETTKALGSLHEMPALRSVAIRAPYNNIGDVGVQLLRPLVMSKSLEDLTLGLSSTLLTDTGLADLLAEPQRVTLRSFVLLVDNNCIGDAGAEALAALAGCMAAPRLKISVASNSLGKAGVQVLQDAQAGCGCTIDM
eukprot:EG_transcript_5022